MASIVGVEEDAPLLKPASDAEDSKPLTRSVYFTGIPSDQDEGPSKVLLSPLKRGGKDSNKYLKTTTQLLVGLKIVICVIFFAIVLTSSVFSKLTLVSLTERLRFVTMHIETNHSALTVFYDQKPDLLKSEAVSIYWQLLVILIVPNFITFFRCLFFGLLGKTRNHFPWPKGKAILLGLLGAAVEVVVLSLFLFVVLASFPPEVSILLLNGVFFVQTALDILRSFRAKNHFSNDCRNILHNNRRQYDLVDNREEAVGDAEPLVNETDIIADLKYNSNKWFAKLLQFLQWLLENWIMKSIAFILQFVGLLGFLIFWWLKIDDQHLYVYKQALIALPFILLSMSVMWSTAFQGAIAKPSIAVGTVDVKVSARYKSSLINSAFRFLLYPLVSYIIFRYATPFNPKIDPWCLADACTINFSGTTINVMIVHIVLSFAGYIFVWISCMMTLGQLYVGIPLLLSTPVALLVYYITNRVEGWSNAFFPPFPTADVLFDELIPGAPILVSLLWFGEVLAMGFFICTMTNIILATDEHMFMTPHYDSIFLEQHIILNRQVKRSFKKSDIMSIVFPHKRKPRMIFICSTMYQENDVEMKQMLLSIYRVAKYYENEQKKNPRSCDRFESHIFFDGAINGNQIENFGLQLLSLLEESLNVKISKGKKMETPYGYKIFWMLGMVEATMPFCIHFKDKNLVKPKKRWSQVMYMNYVINYRIDEEGLDPDNTFILTTDADIEFTADSAIVLLDMLDSNLNVAAVSARTHPKGYGPIYWYQVFDYAIGHWFQKPAEHILGSVLCSPGCFSVFRCSALKQVLEEYSTEVNGASEFLMKDMGEDRWLCTLIIKQGLRLEYCAISEDYTYCPTDFDEFFKQRRRWIPSTIANLFMLVSESGIITKGNDSISILYIFFQAIMIFSTAIAPATIVLVISAGLQTFSIPTYVSIPFFFTVGLVYGLTCLFASPQAQLDLAKLLTFIFSIIMALVIIGIFKDFVESIIPSPTQAIIGPGNCDHLIVNGNATKGYEECVHGLEFASHYNNSVQDSFQLPVTPTVVYIGGLSAAFFLAGVFHFSEIGCLVYSIIYLLALPSGYLLLLIYSAANLCDRSWGTREQKSETDEGVWGWRKNIAKVWTIVTSSRCCIWCYSGGGGSGGVGDEKKIDVSEKMRIEGNEEKLRESIARETKFGGDKSKEAEDQMDGDHLDLRPEVIHAVMDEETRQWLSDVECDMYLQNFEKHGYTNHHLIASMTPEDFAAIGVSKRGHRLRLQREIKSLAPLPLNPGNLHDVRGWLKCIELEEYTELFHFEGYKWRRDIPNLMDLDQAQLEAMGVSKRAHLQRLMLAIEYLSNPPDVGMDMKTRDWLHANECQCYEENFTRHGYTNQHFIARIKAKELEIIGVDKKGFRLRLEKAAQRLPSLPIKIEIPNSVDSWLAELELSQYAELFHREGYRKAEDIVNLKELDEQQLKDMGICKRAHLFRLKVALSSLAKPSIVELNKRRTKGIIDQIDYPSLRELNENEAKFWDRLIKHKLKPLSLKFTQNRDMQKSLESLRNLTLSILLLVNLMWIVLLSSLNFQQLQEYNIDPSAFQLLFLAVYGFIIVVQFLTMLAHRAVTLIHYLGRVKPREVLITPYWDVDFEMISIAEMKRSTMA